MNTCTICGKEMKFVEGDIIHDENWYHGICVKIKKQSLVGVCVKSKTLERNYSILD
jgi:hypothetical protein